ncbi:hypothetical protein [Microcoleus sp. CAWBG24]|nr:hypothetical protein [Microcoleus sp. CAWBG24]
MARHPTTERGRARTIHGPYNCQLPTNYCKEISCKCAIDRN